MACTPSPLARQILAEANRIAPNRDHASDGICGDAAHQTRRSYHNSGDAADTTHDPAGGFDAHAWAERVRSRAESGAETRVDQIISNGRIATSARQYGLVGRRWQWRKYTGTNPHTKHVHYSLNTRPAGGRFFVFPNWDWFEMATEKQLEDAVRKVLNEGTGKGQTNWARTNQAILAGVQQCVNLLTRIVKKVDA